MRKVRVLNAFRGSILLFLDELIDQFPNEVNLVMAKVFLKDTIPIEQTMEKFVEKIEKNDSQLKKMVKKRDENFFLENDIFSIDSYSLGNNRVNHFRNIWQSQIDDEDRVVIWSWIDNFIQLSDLYRSLSH